MNTTTPDPNPLTIPRAVRPLLHRIGRLAEEEGMQAYAVGGCVRDWLLGRPTMDLDVTVEGDGPALAKRVAQAFGVRPTIHQQFGTATVWLPGRSCRVDIAGCRRERYRQPAAYPTVSPGRLRDDLFRRDFTINAMAVALAPARFGAVIDPFQGRRDLRARRLRILHPKSFVDDPSRILRAARLVERFRLTLEASTKRRLRRALADGVMDRLNRGRVRKELHRLLEEPDPAACLARLGRWMSG